MMGTQEHFCNPGIVREHVVALGWDKTKVHSASLFTLDRVGNKPVCAVGVKPLSARG